jgi:hypothetical protein
VLDEPFVVACVAAGVHDPGVGAFDNHLQARPVSTAVNNVRNNGPQLLDEHSA